MINRADPDQLASSTDLGQHFCKGRVCPGSTGLRIVSTKSQVSVSNRRWLGVAKVLCILSHWGIQLIVAYSWARPAILVAGKGRGVMFLFLLFLHFHSCSTFFPVLLFHLFYCLFYFFSPFLWETTQKDSKGLCH